MVNKTNLIIRSNIRKSRRQLVAVVFLMILSALLLNSVFVLKLDYNQTFDRGLEASGAMDFRLAYINLSGQDDRALVSAPLAQDPRIRDFEVDEVYMGDGDAAFADGSISSLIILEKASSAFGKRIDRYEIVEEDESVADGAYVSYLFKTSGMKTGDLCSCSIGNDAYEFRIKGFYNCPLIGTVNCGGIAYVVSDGLYDELTQGKPVSYLMKAQCRDPGDITGAFNDAVGKIAALKTGGFISHSAFADEIATSRYTNANIFRIVLTIAAVTMAVILLAIIAIVMTNYVKENIRSFGTLKAVGYTSPMLIRPLLLEVGAICLLASMGGIGISYAVFPVINRALESQVGIPYQIRFLWVPALLTVAICEATSLVSTFLSVRRIRKIAAIHAIREDRETAGALPNGIDLGKTPLGVNPAVGFSAALQSIARGVILFFTFAGISFLLCFSLFIYQNFIVDNTAVVKVICGEIPNYIVTVDDKDEAALADHLGNDRRVVNHYLFNIKEMSPVDHAVITFIAVEKDSYVTTLDYLIVDGRFPENDGEVTLNKVYAQKNGIRLFDELTFSNENGEYTYRVVGFNQGASRSGTEGYILREGLDRIAPSSNVSYNVFLGSVGDEEGFKADVMENCPILYLLNSRRNVSSMVDMYMTILVVLAIVLCAVSALIAVFVLYVILSLLLGNKRREHGILKAIGFTTRDIVIQTETSVLPFAVAGSAVGLFGSRNLVGALISTALNSIGIFRFGEPLQFGYLFLLWAVLSVFAAVFVALLCRPVAKISTHELFNRE